MITVAMFYFCPLCTFRADGLLLMSCSVLNNTSIQCSHGKFPLSKVGFSKRLSAEAWMKLFSKVASL